MNYYIHNLNLSIKLEAFLNLLLTFVVQLLSIQGHKY